MQHTKRCIWNPEHLKSITFFHNSTNRFTLPGNINQNTRSYDNNSVRPENERTKRERDRKREEKMFIGILCESYCHLINIMWCSLQPMWNAHNCTQKIVESIFVVKVNMVIEHCCEKGWKCLNFQLKKGQMVILLKQKTIIWITMFY